MNKSLILQQVFSQSDYANMLRLTFPRHMDYALRHKMDFKCLMSDVLTKFDQMVGSWAKIVLIAEALAAGYEHVFWLDADAMIWNLGADLRDVFKEMGEASIGACQHPGPPIHLNVGVTFWRNTDAARRFAATWLEAESITRGGWMEQGVFNEMSVDEKWRGVVCRVDDKWNATHYAGTDRADAIIRGYHGPGSFTALMRFQAMMSDLAGIT